VAAAAVVYVYEYVVLLEISVKVVKSGSVLIVSKDERLIASTPPIVLTCHPVIVDGDPGHVHVTVLEVPPFPTILMIAGSAGTEAGINTVLLFEERVV
jgi:hypothetical protein